MASVIETSAPSCESKLSVVTEATPVVSYACYPRVCILLRYKPSSALAELHQQWILFRLRDNNNELILSSSAHGAHEDRNIFESSAFIIKAIVPF